MKDCADIISGNLKKIREEQKLSLDNVAKLTGVSKSMIGQIERGEVSPTITTLWKIANGLKLSFTALLSRPQSDIEIIRKADVEPLTEDNGKFKNYALFPFDETRRFEIYTVDMAQGSYLSAEPHPQGSQEFITVYSGELTVRVQDEEYTVQTGDSIRFKADSPHTYHNSGAGAATLSLVIYYAN